MAEAPKWQWVLGKLFQGRVGWTFKLKLLHGNRAHAFFFYPKSFGFTSEIVTACQTASM